MAEVANPLGIPADIGKQLRTMREIEELDKTIQRARLLMTLTEKDKSAAIKQQR